MHARAGYRILPFVAGFTETSLEPVPQVHNTLTARDYLGTVLARLGATRSNYTVTPGLYCVGTPNPDSPVVVTANYKLTFDSVRKELNDLNAWLLVLDTRGINVWCAAGKDLFSTAEVIRQVQLTRLKQLVNHRQLILPQLAATGTAAGEVYRGCGFKVIYGPVRAVNLPDFLARSNTATDSEREVTFSLSERAKLIPVELVLLWKPLLISFGIILVLSGFGPWVFSGEAMLSRGGSAVLATVLGLLAGGVAVPLLLPWLPARSFWIKGLLTGVVTSGILLAIWSASHSWQEMVALCCWLTACSTYMAMNFTGSTPFTSPSGVEQEMRVGIPVQLFLTLLALVTWLAIPFLG